MDPRVKHRMWLIGGQLRLCEKAILNIQGRIAEAHRELNQLLAGPCSDAASGKIAWTEFQVKARELRVALQVVTYDGDILATRWKDYLMLADLDVKEKQDSEKRQYRVPLEKLDQPPGRPVAPAPMEFPKRG